MQAALKLASAVLALVIPVASATAQEASLLGMGLSSPGKTLVDSDYPSIATTMRGRQS